MDRFMMKLNMGYPTVQEESELLARVQLRHPIEEVEAVIDSEQLKQLQEQVKHVHVDDTVRDYIVQISHQTRQHSSVYIGVSPRGSITLFRACQAYAFLDGRDYVIPDDVKVLAKPVLAHRIILHTESRLDGISNEHVVDQVLQRIAVPVRAR